MKRSCCEIQSEIIRQQSIGEILDSEINSYQENSTSLLKQLIIEKHLYIQRIFVTENYVRGTIKDPLEQTGFSQIKEISPNFASLEFPGDFSKGPMKAFLNTLLDSLESFLPAFYKFKPSKIPRGSFPTDPSLILVHCVFPALFGNCWASEPANAYGENLVRWFHEISCDTQNFINDFKTHWMFQAITGFFNSIDLVPFVVTAFRSLFFDYVQLQADVQLQPQTLLSFASRAVKSIRDHYFQLPSVLNGFFISLIKEVRSDNPIQILVRDIFYEALILPIFKYPILHGLSDIPLDEADYVNFWMIYAVIQVALGIENPLTTAQKDEIKSLNEFKDLNPLSIENEIQSSAAKRELPSLQTFCNIVQCYHQPLLMTTHSLSLLFRFVASLQHTALLPKSIDRSISTVFQEALADTLEEWPDQLFWFPCFSLAYLNIASTCFSSPAKVSPIYKLLSSQYLKLPKVETSFIKAFEVALKTTSTTTHPEIRTQINWMLSCENPIEKREDQLDADLKTVAKELEQKRERASKLRSFSVSVSDIIQEIPSFGAKMAMATAILPSFKAAENHGDIVSNLFISGALGFINHFCGKSYNTIGAALLTVIIMKLTPSIKTKATDEFNASKDCEEVSALRKLVSREMNVSSLLSKAVRLSRDCLAVESYSELSKTEDCLQKCFSPPFFSDPHSMSINLSGCLLILPQEVLSLIFSDGEMMALRSFCDAFPLK